MKVCMCVFRPLISEDDCTTRAIQAGSCSCGLQAGLIMGHGAGDETEWMEGEGMRAGGLQAWWERKRKRGMIEGDRDDKGWS